MLTRLPWVAAAILIVMAAAAPAQAQALNPSASVAAGEESVEVGQGGKRTVTWVVSNTGTAVPLAPGGPTDATATVTLTVPDGWAASLAPGDASFALAPGGSRTVTVLASPADGAPAEGPADGALILSATMTDPAGRTSPPASAATTLSFQPPPATVLQKDYTRFLWVAGTSLLLLGTIVAGTVVYLRRAAQVAILVDAEQRPITSGTDGIFLVQVENRSNVRREVELQVQGLPASWYGAFSFPKVQLAPGERGPVPLCIKVPPGAGDGHQVELVLRARPSSRFPWRASARTLIEAHDRIRIGNPAAPAPPK